jgi:hypothetical protein
MEKGDRRRGLEEGWRFHALCSLKLWNNLMHGRTGFDGRIGADKGDRRKDGGITRCVR